MLSNGFAQMVYRAIKIALLRSYKTLHCFAHKCGELSLVVSIFHLSSIFACPWMWYSLDQANLDFQYLKRMPGCRNYPICCFYFHRKTALTVEIQDKATRCLLFFPRIIELVVVSRIASFCPVTAMLIWIKLHNHWFG